MPQPQPRFPVKGGPPPGRRLTTLAEVVASLQDSCDDDRQVVRALRALLAQGRLRRLTPRVSRAA